MIEYFAGAMYPSMKLEYRKISNRRQKVSKKNREIADLAGRQPDVSAIDYTTIVQSSMIYHTYNGTPIFWRSK
jgi:hypothetical protein